MSKPRVLLVGWDAADWKLIRPLLQSGEMPHLARLIETGVHGNLATIYPVLSPMLWTSIATGKRAYKHGIHGFSEPLPNGSGVRPISTLSRQSKAIWNILNQNGHRSIVVGWWPSHPAEPIDGVMVSNHFQQAVGTPDKTPPLPSGTIHPRRLSAALAELRVNPMELTGEFLELFVPEWRKVDQATDKRLHTLGKIIAETMSIHAVASELLETQPWDFAAIYYSGLDHFGHAFMGYHPPRMPWIQEADFEIYHPVVANAYRYHDAMLGGLMRLVDENTTVIVMSDHGFHSDHLRPGYIPAEPAGPAVEHRHFGVLCMKGPQLHARLQLYGASVLDVCPTLLTLFGLPPGSDMDGKVLTTAFRNPPAVNPIASWDEVDGQAGTHSPETQLDPVASAEAFQQLVELGYVEPPGPNVKETVAGSMRELKYNLARAHLDGNQGTIAATLARELWDEWPDEHRFGLLLADCLGAVGQVSERRRVIDELDRHISQCRTKAQEELAQRQNDGAPQTPPAKPRNEAEKRRHHFELRKLHEQAMDRSLLLDALRLQQAFLEDKPVEARRLLKQFENHEVIPHAMRHRMAGALAQLGHLDDARQLLEASLEIDPESPQAHAQLAGIHFKAGRMEETIAAATEALSLLYFQPGMHALLGRALMELGRYDEAEKALLVAVAQSNRNLLAHEALAQLYREHVHQPDKAFAHEGRAQSLRNELTLRQRAESVSAPAAAPAAIVVTSAEDAPREDEPLLLEPFPTEVDPAKIITVVSGLPRSGTSLMMQLLVAGGRTALTDGRRPPDPDNPLGYLEFEPATRLARDKSWLPQARGKVVKIVAQLLPSLPRNEHYNILFMERHLAEIVASQRAMLERLDRPGRNASLDQLTETFRHQVRRVLKHLRQRKEVRVWVVSYEQLLAHSEVTVREIAGFLGGTFDGAKAVAAVRPELRRQKA